MFWLVQSYQWSQYTVRQRTRIAVAKCYSQAADRDKKKKAILSPEK